MGKRAPTSSYFAEAEDARIHAQPLAVLLSIATTPASLHPVWLHVFHRERSSLCSLSSTWPGQPQTLERVTASSSQVLCPCTQSQSLCRTLPSACCLLPLSTLACNANADRDSRQPDSPCFARLLNRQLPSLSIAPRQVWGALNACCLYHVAASLPGVADVPCPCPLLPAQHAHHCS